MYVGIDYWQSLVENKRNFWLCHDPVFSQCFKLAIPVSGKNKDCLLKNHVQSNTNLSN